MSKGQLNFDAQVLSLFIKKDVSLSGTGSSLIFDLVSEIKPLVYVVHYHTKFNFSKKH